MVQTEQRVKTPGVLPPSLTITQVTSEHQNEARKFNIRWKSVVDAVLLFTVRLTVTYDNGTTATVSDVFSENQRSAVLFVSEIPGFFKVVRFNVVVTAISLKGKIHRVTARQSGPIEE